MTKGWLKIEKQWLKIIEVRNTMTGKAVKWSHTHTILAAYLTDRYNHFKGIHKEFFDNQENISAEVGMSLSVVQRRMKDLSSIGALRTTKKKLRGFVSSNSYVVLDVFSVPMFQVILDGGEIAMTDHPVRPHDRSPVRKKFENKLGEIDPEAPF